MAESELDLELAGLEDGKSLETTISNIFIVHLDLWSGFSDDDANSENNLDTLLDMMDQATPTLSPSSKRKLKKSTLDPLSGGPCTKKLHTVSDGEDVDALKGTIHVYYMYKVMWSYQLGWQQWKKNCSVSREN